jgi:ketosteroid isomerase-like protein
MSTVENKKLIQDAFTAWARGDGMAFFNLLAPNVRWTVIGSKLAGPIVPTVRDIIAEGDKVALQWEGRTSGKNGTIYHQTYCWVMRLVDGKVHEGTAYLDTELITQLWN